MYHVLFPTIFWGGFKIAQAHMPAHEILKTD